LRLDLDKHKIVPPTTHINPSGDSMVSGTLSLGGDLYDVTNGKKIYDGVAGKFDPSVMPYEKGDLTSDWASSSYSSGYYEAVGAGDVKSGVSYGRAYSGTLLPPSGTAGASDVGSGKTFYSGSWEAQTGTGLICLGSWHYEWVRTGFTGYYYASGATTSCTAATFGSAGYESGEGIKTARTWMNLATGYCALYQCKKVCY